MNTATNIQLADRGPNEINENNTKVLAGIIVGGLIAAAYMLPGNASADIPSRPVGDPGSTAYASATNTANLFDMDLIDPGFYDAKTVGASPGWEALQTDNIT